jgi:membrane-bound lytic murein transglycosylase B
MLVAAVKRATLLRLLVLLATLALLTGESAARIPVAGELPTVGLPTDRHQLAAAINRAEAVIDDPSSAPTQLEAAGSFQQLAAGRLAREHRGARNAVLVLLEPRAAASIRADVAAAAALSGLVERHTRLPPWKIVQPPPPRTLLSYFRSAAQRFGIPWQYLAAIELVETKFGRVHGPSSAGAQGPMQFLPSTWARYGRGDIHNQRDAILGAARYLVASGARTDMAAALYRYNHSQGYVRAVREYALRMRAAARAYYGYYYWQVLYVRGGRTVVLPVGYPRVRPVPVRFAHG